MLNTIGHGKADQNHSGYHLTPGNMVITAKTQKISSARQDVEKRELLKILSECNN